MRCKALILALTALGGVASAQPGPQPGPPPPPMDTTQPPPDPMPTPDPTPPPVAQDPTPVANNAPPPQLAVEEPSADRPVGWSVALGFGWSFPTDLQAPNITTARLRLASGIQIEPALRISNTSSDQDTPTGEETDKLTSFGLAALVRIPIVSRGKADLEAIGYTGFSNTKSNPEGDYNATTSNLFTLGYGVGVAYWLSQHWQISTTITNALVEYRQSKVQNGVPNMTTKSSDTTLGIVFSPAVIAMIHLYN